MKKNEKKGTPDYYWNDQIYDGDNETRYKKKLKLC